MSTPRTIRMIRVRRAAAISVAAVAVVLGPTACDSASAGDSSGYGAGHPQHDGAEVVNVANKERAERDGSGREGARDGRDRDGRDRDGREDRDPDVEGEDAAAPEGEDAAAPEGEDAAAPEGEDAAPADAGAAPQEASDDAPPPNEIAGEEVLSSTCDDSGLPPHDGFQIAPACVSAEMGEVPEQAKGAQLLIVKAPERVPAGEAIVIEVSTRNLVRDRFLPAAQGGYYLERSHLNDDGIVRGHFHAACRLLGDTSVAPEPDRNDSFIAIEDNQGDEGPDVVTVTLPGLPEEGEAQCAAWAGDGSHRMPLMQFANQIPAFDAVRMTIE